MIYETPINKLSQNLQNNNFYIKRDDLIPFSFGGNKARKAINFFKEIDKGNYTSVITYGSSSSNHCRIIANAAAARGLKCIIISPEEGYHNTANSKIIELFGSEIIKTSVKSVSETIDVTIKKLEKSEKPYFIPGGGHGNHGTKAYVDAYNEIYNYEKINKLSFDYIFHASGTGTTQSGLICGQILKNDFHSQIIGISIARSHKRGKAVIEDSIKEFLGTDTLSTSVNFIDKYTCGGYGITTPEITDTIKSVLISDGIPLNSTYTAKAFHGMNQYIIDNKIESKNILFINTGGTPLFFDDLENLI